MKALGKNLREILRYPSAIAGMALILMLVLLSVYTLVTIPYDEAVRLWRGGEDVWYMNPKAVPPEWTNWFRSSKLPASFLLNSTASDGEEVVTEDGTVLKTYEAGAQNEILITYTFDYQFDAFPQEMIFYFTSNFEEKNPYVSITWYTPDGREIRVGDLSIGQSQSMYTSQEEKLKRRLGGKPPMIGLFADPDSDPENPVALKGTYQIVITSFTFEEGSDIDAEFVFHGQVDGWAGTDHRRRDIGVAILWGTPIALMFGLIAAMGTTFLTMIIAAIGVWFGGWVDELIQRITGVNLVLPFLPILIMIGTFYSRSIWLILGAVVALSIFGSGIITYRSVFMQVKESPYIEAARSYGASSWRIILFYLLPRIIPMLIPTLVTAIPGYVFTEASLAVLGLGDPVLPTWGKIINDAQGNGALYQGLYYWVLEPAVLLMITGLAFAMLGFSLDRIFNPRLRGQ
jgi:peptide/nickel transport system permease protein